MHTNTLPCVVHDVIVLYVWSRLYTCQESYRYSFHYVCLFVDHDMRPQTHGILH